MKNKQGTPSNYVRIVYLKEMRESTKSKQPEESTFTRNSLAYLSSLIQQDNKKRMNNSVKVSMDWSSTPLITQIRDIPKISKNTQPLYYQKQDNPNQSRKLGLNRLLNVRRSEKIPSIDFRQKAKVIKLTQADLLNRQQELHSSFMTFCSSLKNKNDYSLNQKSVSNQKQPDKIIYTSTHKQETPIKILNKKRLSLSQTKNPKDFRRRSIVYRKNFKEINNFDWGKIAEESFDISNLKYV